MLSSCFYVILQITTVSVNISGETSERLQKQKQLSQSDFLTEDLVDQGDGLISRFHIKYVNWYQSVSNILEFLKNIRFKLELFIFLT